MASGFPSRPTKCRRRNRRSLDKGGMYRRLEQRVWERSRRFGGPLRRTGMVVSDPPVFPDSCGSPP